ncbi:hypothetical protein H8356DRAFT_1374237 [Neocallimastix lanati (nom. inval.)]|uniref:Uncharacterized protein n=1 Tax=Neocallimastix californiae TaxID=1754190 RepID=A0A1Y2AL95_9FUNG|nr:hypothetical protein H8356DRAFT_1374237 [Neocallimastix sp. JGI-2020a]ORY23286.1 hypothetical protein LY90DRAFT_706892 [Neocallimastix californiae]|eukprot:ORY23286.1 hypothetical protein LY90DRAFT_706892 [Neocallimastix californiae]
MVAKEDKIIANEDQNNNNKDIKTNYINALYDDTSSNYKNFSKELTIPYHMIVVVRYWKLYLLMKFL